VLRVIRYTAIALIVILLGAVALVQFDPFGQRPAAVASTTISEVGGEFALLDQNGQTRRWSNFRGKAAAVFFGFTHCPEICPATLFEMSEALKALGPRGDALNVVLITVDPERDTPAVLKRYLHAFDPRIVALTGSDAAVEEAVGAFRAYRKRLPTEGGDYTMDHTAVVYLFDPGGRLVSTLDRHETREVQMQKIERAIAGGD
jgi:protein SCO1